MTSFYDNETGKSDLILQMQVQIFAVVATLFLFYKIRQERSLAGSSGAVTSHVASSNPKMV